MISLFFFLICLILRIICLGKNIILVGIFVKLCKTHLYIEIVEISKVNHLPQRC